MVGIIGRTVQPATEVYSVSLPHLIIISAQLTGVKKETYGRRYYIRLQTGRSRPLSMSGSLLAVGGWDKGYNNMTTVQLYRPDTGERLKVTNSTV